MKQQQMDPVLTSSLIAGIQVWQEGKTTEDDTPASTQQSQIGWGAALDGWLGTEWQAQQEAYWMHWRCWKSSHCWTVELIKKLWNISWDIWDHCNEELHQATEYQAEILDSLINNQVKTFYERGPQAVPHDAIVFFNDNLDVLLQKPKHYKEHWVALVQAAIQQKKYHKYGAYISEQCGM